MNNPNEVRPSLKITFVLVCLFAVVIKATIL
jgi:hypothetical protein